MQHRYFRYVDKICLQVGHVFTDGDEAQWLDLVEKYLPDVEIEADDDDGDDDFEASLYRYIYYWLLAT